MVKKSVTVFLYVLAAALIVLCVCMPSGSIALLPPLCMLGYYFSRQLRRVWILAVIASVYAGAGTLFHGVSFVYIGGAVLLAVLILPAALNRRLPFWGEAALCAAVCVVAVFGVIGIWAIASHGSFTDVIADEILSLSADPLACGEAARAYARISEEQLGHAHLSSSDEGYVADTLAALAEVVGWELDGNVLWYLSGFGTFCGGLACAGGLAIVSARKEPIPLQMRHIRQGRRYLLEICLPVAVFAFAAFYPPLEPVVRAVVNVAITLPCTLTGLTLIYHTLMRLGGKARIAAIVGFWAVVAVAAVFYEWGMLILGFVGLADAIIDVRAMLDKALE